MALDGNIDKTVKAPDGAVLSSLNLNSVSDKPASKPVQVADDGVFDRNRGKGQPHPGGRAHPFSDTGVTIDPDGKLKVGQDPSLTPNKVEPFKDHVADQTPKLQDLGDKMQDAVHAAASGRIQGNAIAVGFADNAKRAQDLTTHWDLIGEQGGIIGAAGSAARVIGVGATAFAMGTYAHGKLQRELSAEKASTVPVYDGHRSSVVSLKDTVDQELVAARTDPARATEATLLQEKSKFLSDFIHGNTNGKLDALSQFNKDRPAAFSTADRDAMKAMAETEMKLSAVNKGLNVGTELTGFKGFYEHGKSGLWNGMKFVAGSLGLNYALKEGINLLPGDHHETDRIFTQSTQESVAQGLIGAAPIRNFGTKLALGGAAWLAGREEKMTWGESVVSTVGAMGATVAAGLAVPSLRSSVPKALAFELGAFAVGRGVHLIPGLGDDIPALTDASTSAWNSMKNDSQKMSGSSFRDAVDSFDELGVKWRGVLAAYDRDIMGGINNKSLPILHGDDDPLKNYQNIVINSRTGMVLSESLGNTVLKSGLTEDTKSDLLQTYHQQSSDEEPASDQTTIAPNQGDLDLTSRAARSYMQALALADVTMVNMKSAQQADGVTSGKNISDSDIKAVADEKAKIEKVMTEKILRSAPGAEAHDIKDIVEGTDGWVVSANKFKLTDYAKHDKNGYSKMVTALETKAYTARDSWLPGQVDGPNGDISKQYVAKTFRDAAVMRLGFMNYLLTTQDGHSSAPSAQDVQEMKIYMEGTQIGNQLDGAHANRNVKSTVEAAYALDPNNPDMKAIVDEYNSIAKRVLGFNQNYSATHGGQDAYKNSIANPFGVEKPANAR